MALPKVTEGVDQVGGFASKYNASIKEHIMGAALDGSNNLILTKDGGTTLSVALGQLNVVSGLTYSQIDTIKSGNLLQIGKYYELSFNTIDCIDYSDTVYTGATETLYLLATSLNTFHHQVYSKQYPQDIIYFDFDNNAFDTQFSGIRVSRNGYIYYRSDTFKNLTVDGYDFRTHILKRYQVDATNYNQFSASTVYNVGDIAWSSNVLYICTYGHTSAGSINTLYWNKLLDSSYYGLVNTGSTTYGTATIYALNSNTTGYTFSLTSSITSGVNNITITSFKNYKTSGNFYTSSNFLNKPNIVIWGSSCYNMNFDQNCYDITIANTCYNNNFISSNNIYLTNSNINCIFNNSNAIYLTVSSNYLNLFESSMIFGEGSNASNNLEYCNKIHLTNSSYNQINFSNYLYCNGVTYSTYISSNFIHTVTSNNQYNEFSNSNNIFFSGSYNNFDYCNAFGTRSGLITTSYSDYNTGCSYFDTLNDGSVSYSVFDNQCANIWVMSGQTLSSSSFTAGVTNFCFSGSTVQNFQYLNINTKCSGSSIGGTTYNSAGVITKTTINNSSFISINGSSQPIAVAFSGGTIPYYTNITTYA